MENGMNPAALVHRPTRRRAIAIVSCALAAGYRSLAENPLQTMHEVPATSANKTRTSLHEDIEVKSTPQRIYEALMDARQFAKFSGMPATIDPTARLTVSSSSGCPSCSAERVSGLAIARATRSPWPRRSA